MAPNLLEQNFTAAAPNQAWVGDITYVWTLEGWAYLAVLLDLCSRRVVGWALRRTLSRELALAALRRALRAHDDVRGLVHHTDRGSQYASRGYRQVLVQHGIRQSMSGVGNCYDNAVAESFFAALKNGAGAPLRLRDADRGVRRDRRLHRELLQRGTPAFRHRIRDTGRTRASHPSADRGVIKRNHCPLNRGNFTRCRPATLYFDFPV